MTWLRDRINAVSVEVEGGSDDQVLALAASVGELRNGEWSAYVDGIQLDPLPEAMQAWGKRR